MLRVLRHGAGSFLLLALFTGCVASSHTERLRTKTVVINCATETCADDGFDVQRDGFSFPNWNDVDAFDSSVDVHMLITMFGQGVVCLPGPTTSCTPTPRALHLIDEWNNALRGGRCEGMAVLSERMFIDLVQPRDFDTSVLTTAQLTRGNEQLESAITYWWATQFTDDISTIAHASREQFPSEIVEQLVHGLSTSAGYTLALYDHGMGHSLTPYAVSETSDGWRIHVYDNNFPGVDNHIDVNSSTEQWTYSPQHTVADTDASERSTSTLWSGSTGAIELIPMSARSGPFQCSTCDDQSGTARDTEDVVISLVPLSQHAELGLEIETPNGTISTLVGQPKRDNGVDITMSKDGTMPRLTRIKIPAHLQPFDVRVTASSLTVSPPPVLLTVSHPGVASVHLRGMLARAHTRSETQRDQTPNVSIDSSGLRFHTDVVTTASVALTTDIAELDVQPGHQLVISRLAQSNISITDDRNNVIYSGSYGTSDLGKDPTAQRHLLTFSHERYTVVDVDIPPVALPISLTRNTLERRTTESTTPQIPTPTNSFPKATESSTPSTSSTTVPTTSMSSTTLPSRTSVLTSDVVMTTAATPHLLYVDDRDSAWLRIGNERAITHVFADGTHTKREIDGVPIAATQDDVGTLWVLLQQPDRLLQLTPSSLTYHSHPQLNAPTSIGFSPTEREIVIAGGRDDSSYFAVMSSQGSFHFQSLSGITLPNLLTLDAQSRMWFVDAGGGSISRINADKSVDTFRRSIVMARAIILGPDNAMWFINNVAGNELGRISMKGTYSFAPAPSAIDTLRDITSVDGELWLTARASVVRMNLDRTTTVISDAHPWGQATIKRGSGRTLWFTNANFFTLSRITM